MEKKKKLRRSRTDKVLTGVLGGIAKYYGINATILRIICAIALIPTSFTLIIVYTILSYAIPREDPEEAVK